MDKTAFHEASEVLLLRIRFISEARFISDEETGEEIHNIIRTLERVIWQSELKNLDKRIKTATKIMKNTIRENIIL